jgi:hypothetical protein
MTRDAGAMNGRSVFHGLRLVNLQRIQELYERLRPNI